MNLENLNQKNLIPEIKKDILEKVESDLSILKNIDTFIDIYVKDFEDELEKSNLEESKKKELQDKLKSNLSDIKDLLSEIDDIIEIKIEVRSVVLSIEDKFKELIREELPEKWQEIISQENFDINHLEENKKDLFWAKEATENRKEELDFYETLLKVIVRMTTNQHNDVREGFLKQLKEVVNDFKIANNLNISLNKILCIKNILLRRDSINDLLNNINSIEFQEIKKKY